LRRYESEGFAPDAKIRRSSLKQGPGKSLARRQDGGGSAAGSLSGLKKRVFAGNGRGNGAGMLSRRTSFYATSFCIGRPLLRPFGTEIGE
jgi:hypothetical protein